MTKSTSSPGRPARRSRQALATNQSRYSCPGPTPPYSNTASHRQPGQITRKVTCEKSPSHSPPRTSRGANTRTSRSVPQNGQRKSGSGRRIRYPAAGIPSIFHSEAMPYPHGWVRPAGLGIFRPFLFDHRGEVRPDPHPPKHRDEPFHGRDHHVRHRATSRPDVDRIGISPTGSSEPRTSDSTGPARVNAQTDDAEFRR